MEMVWFVHELIWLSLCDSKCLIYLVSFVHELIKSLNSGVWVPGVGNRYSNISWDGWAVHVYGEGFFWCPCCIPTKCRVPHNVMELYTSVYVRVKVGKEKTG